MPPSPPPLPWHRRLLRLVGASALAGYLAWNLWWLTRWQVPPSIFKAVTGLPCPTTGGTRSFLCLVRGEWQESLRYNALTVPLLLLLAVTLGLLGWQLASRRRLRLPPALFWAWAAVLAAAWVLKLAGDPMYW
ncbi:MAG TPA: DUF2752 domain-containing protein [Gemmataceae bacterium]|nr:DUF2752 domain-containing protein [Gemmataceae bacterium]